MATAPVGSSSTGPTTGGVSPAGEGGRLSSTIISAVNNGLQGLTSTLSSLSSALEKQSALYTSNATSANKSTKSMDEVVAALKKLNDQTEAAAKLNKNRNDVDKIALKDAEQALKNDKKANEAAERAIKQKEEEARLTKQSYGALRASLQKVTNEQTEAAKGLATARQNFETAVKAAKSGTNATTTAQLTAASKAYNDQKQVLSAVNDKYSFHSKILAEHTTLTSLASAKLEKFASVAALAASATQLYREAQDAKTTGTYTGIGDFLTSSFNNIMLGVSSAEYNKLRAQTRGASLSSESQSTFKSELEASTDTLSRFTATTGEAAKIAADVYTANAAAGISSKLSNDNMKNLGDSFNQLSKITGKATSELAQMSVAMMQDIDVRTVMLGMSEAERAGLNAKINNDRVQLVQQGFSIEQATELQKLAMRQREMSIQDLVTHTAKAQQAQNLLIAQATGPAKIAMQATLSEKLALEAKQRESSLTGTERVENQRQIDALNAKFNTQAAEMLGNSKQSQVAAAQGQQFLKQSYEATGVGKELNATGVKGGKIGENQKATLAQDSLGNSGVMKFLTSAEGMVVGLASNTAATVLLTIAMGLLTRRLGKGLLSEVGPVKDILSKVFGKGGSAVESAAKAGEFIGPPTKAGFLKSTAPEMLKDASSASSLKGMLKTPIAKKLGWVGLALTAAGAIGEIADINTGVSTGALSEKQGTAKKAGLAGDLAGGAAGAWGGAAAGGAAGAWLAPVTFGLSVPIGAAIGGMLGAWGGSAAGGAIAEKAALAVVKDGPAGDRPSDKLTEIQSTQKAEQEKQNQIKAQAAEAERIVNAGSVSNASASLDDLQRQFYVAGIEYFKAVDPKADTETKAKYAAQLQRMVSVNTLNQAPFSALASAQD